MRNKILKVIFITQDEPYYIPIYLNKVIVKLGEEAKIVKVYALPPNLPQKNFIQTVQYYSYFFGFIIFAYLIILRIYYLICDFLNNYLKISNQYHSAKLICRKYKIPFSKIQRISSKEVLSELRKLEPDIIYSLASPQVFGKELLTIPRLASLNIHSSLLPKYRGINANFWVMLKGEKTTGVTIHYMNEEIDAGNILLQKEINIKRDWSLNDLYHHMIDLGSSAIEQSLRIIAHEEKEVIKENEISKGSYFTFPTKKDVREFRSKGRKFFNFFKI